MRERGVPVSNAILSNHESPLRDERFVTGKIARGVAAIVRGELEFLTLGNLDVEKDWSAATDIVDGLARIAALDEPTDVILASGKTTALHELVAAAFNAVEIGSWPEFVRIDENLVRPAEPLNRSFDVSRALNLLGWSARIPAESWMGNMVKAALKG
jgi:GDPmannose 4,6-dehydratase